MNEASKTKAVWGEFELGLLSGKGIDIGCGADPITEGVRRFDMEHGDANEITKYVDEQFDFVFAAHCLEHMHDPAIAIKEWWQLVRPGGHMILIVPDEDLYELGYYPSLFNGDHKTTFTISKKNSWSPRSYNIIDLVNSLEQGELIDIQLQDANYDRGLMNHGIYPRNLARFCIRQHNSIVKRLKKLGLNVNINFLPGLLRYPLDQTRGDAMAQIQAIVKKRAV
jgi:SAM-dependent methyltransferase